jgi:hypothetical protein
MNTDETDFSEQPHTDIARGPRLFGPRAWLLVVAVGLRLATIAACVTSPDDGARQGQGVAAASVDGQRAR